MIFISFWDVDLTVGNFEKQRNRGPKTGVKKTHKYRGRPMRNPTVRYAYAVREKGGEK